MTTSQARNTSEHITVGIDGSPASRAAMCWAIDHAREGDTITFMHVWEASPAMVDAGLCEPDDNTAALSFAHHELARAEALPRAVGVSLRTEVLHGDARHCLRQLDTDLLVVGAGGHRGVGGRVLGSVSYYLARHATLPLVIVPSLHR